ncbi:MAG TPA: hypothetical protein VGI45_29240 [Terracidiphilus sp.]
MEAHLRFTKLASRGAAILTVALVAGCATASSAAPASAGPAMTWTAFQDPFEQAFIVEVPQGWKARGGLFRMGFSDERPMVDLLSPDERINVRLGDVSISTYTNPNANHPREGEVYDLGAQAQLVVARYRTGPEFAVLYSHVRFYQDCHGAQGDAGDLGFTVPDYIPSEGPAPPKTSAGGISYRCGSGGNGRIAFAFARTSETGNIWSVPTMGSYLAPPDGVAVARAVLLHCAQTFKLNPAWIEKQKQMDAYAMQYQRARQQQRMQALAQQVQQFEQKMQAMRNQVASFERHQAAFQSQVDGFDQALRGVTPTIDPFTGEAKEVWTGQSSNYWENGRGDVVNSVNAPQGNWQQMTVTRPVTPP